MASFKQTPLDFLQFNLKREYVEVKFRLSTGKTDGASTTAGNVYVTRNVTYKQFKKFSQYMEDINQVFEDIREDTKPDLKIEASKLKDEIKDLFE